MSAARPLPYLGPGRRAEPLAPPGVTARPSLAAVLLLSALMAYADGFWMTSLQGAIGAIERTQGPFIRWLSDSTMMLPMFAAAVWLALRRGHRRYGPALRAPRPVLATALLAALAGTVVGVVALAASSAYDYHLQVQLLELVQGAHGGHPTVPSSAQDAGSCVGLCQAQRATLALHVRAVLDASLVLLGTNLLLVGWAVALRGGQLGSGHASR